jgi:hypothetical protein
MMKKILSVFVVCLLIFGVVSACGGGGADSGSNLPNMFTGEFFTINCTYDFTVTENEMGATLQDSKSELKIEVMGIPMPESREGELDSVSMITDDIESEVSNVTKKEIKLGKHKAFWVEGDNNGLHGVMTIVPLDGWVVIGTVDEPGRTDAEVELSRQIIRSLKITKPDHMSDALDLDAKKDNDIPNEIDEDEDDPVSESEENDDESNNSENESKPIEVGNGAMKLDADYKGNYFTVKHPSSAEIMDFNMGNDDMVMFTIDKLNVTIMATTENESINSESGVGVEDIKVSGHDAKLFEVNMGDAMVSQCILDMGSWWIILMGTSEGSETGGDADTYRAMISSFKITDTNYLGD